MCKRDVSEYNANTNASIPRNHMGKRGTATGIHRYAKEIQKDMYAQNLLYPRKYMQYIVIAKGMQREYNCNAQATLRARHRPRLRAGIARDFRQRPSLPPRFPRPARWPPPHPPHPPPRCRSFRTFGMIGPFRPVELVGLVAPVGLVGLVGLVRPDIIAASYTSPAGVT